MQAVHIAITRKVKRGLEEPFQAALRNFARESLGEAGTTGVHLVGPLPGGDGQEFGILRSFESEAACHAFYDSPLFAKWQDQVAPLVEEDCNRRQLHGFEAFFRSTSQPPPRWKMAIVTWLGVFPAVLLWSSILPRLFSGLHPILMTAIVSGLVVAMLAWGIMPLLTKALTGWLQSPARENTLFKR